MARKIVLPFIALLALAACNGQTPATQGDSANATSNVAANADHQVAAASEAFEQLTEGAFASDPAKVNSLVSAALVAGRVAQDALPQPRSDDLATNLAAIEQAHIEGSAADLANASNEAYRTAVSAISGEQAVPLEVSLLDYAGFRVTADLKADPRRWADIAEALAFADEQWSGLKDRVPDKALADKFGATLDAIDKAVAARDAKLTAQFATTELDQVDLLEMAFSNAPSGG